MLCDICSFGTLNQLNNSRIANTLITAIRQKAANCIVVEDSEAGVKAAKSAKMKCIGYAPEGAIKQDLHQADTVVKEFSDKLIEYIMEK